MKKAFVLWIGPRDRGIPTCVGVPMEWLVVYRARVVTEWRGVILAVYRPKASPVASAQSEGGK